MKFPLFIASIVLLFSCVPSAHAAADKTSLAAYWTFNEGTSTTAGDFSGNGSTGTLTNISTPATATSGWNAGKFGKGIIFDGSNDYVTGTVAANTTTYTVSAWLRYDGALPGGVIKVALGFGSGAGGANTLWMGINNNGNFTVSNSSTDPDGPALVRGVWHHMVGVVSGGTMTTYADGVSFGSVAMSTRPGNVLVAGAYSSTAFPWPGAVDEVRVYNRALTAAEVTQMYNAKASLPRPANNLGLKGYWKFDEGTSTTAGDFSGNRYTGTLSTAGSAIPTWSVGRFGKSLGFNALTAPFVDVPSLNNVMTYPAITVSAWYYQVGTLANHPRIVNNSHTDASNAGFQMYVADDGCTDNSGGNTMKFGVGVSVSGNICANSLVQPVPGTWYHIIGTYDGATVKIYINGVLSGTTAAGTGNLAVDSNNFVIGRGVYGGDYVTGLVDDVRVYNRALSATEIAGLYNQGSATRANASSADLTNGTSLQTGLVGLWTFDGKDMNWTSATAGFSNDSSGNGNTGTLTSMTRSAASAIGKLGQGLNIDGVGSYVSVPTALNSLITGNNITVSTWAKVNGSSFPQQDTVLVTEGFSQFVDNTVRFSLTGNHDTGGSSTTVTAGFYDGVGGTNWHTATAAFTFGQWVHITGTYDGLTVRLYLNGVQASATSYTGTLPAATDSWYFGKRWDAPTFLNGALDDVRVYNRALSAEEVKKLYQLGNSTIKP